MNYKEAKREFQRNPDRINALRLIMISLRYNQIIDEKLIKFIDEHLEKGAIPYLVDVLISLGDAHKFDYFLIFLEDYLGNRDIVFDAYLSAFLWITEDIEDEDEDEEDELEEDDSSYVDRYVDKEKIRKDILYFIFQSAIFLLEDFMEETFTYSQIGHDLILTRNGSGVGFNDRDFYRHRKTLADIARKMGTHDI